MRSMWMLVAAFMFACMGVLVKLSATHFSSTELVFYRSTLFGVLDHLSDPSLLPFISAHNIGVFTAGVVLLV